MQSNYNTVLAEIANPTGPSTNAIFETPQENYIGVALLSKYAPQNKPWLVWIEDKLGLYEVMGFFAMADEGWTKCQHFLGIKENKGLPRQEGERMDGGPFNPNDSTHVR